MNALMDVGDIEAMLEDRIESLCHELLPNGIKQGHEWCTSNLTDARTGSYSLRVHVGNGAKRGWWKDFSSHEGGDALKLVAAVLFGGDIKRAIVWAKSWLRLDDEDPQRIEQHRLEARGRAEGRAAEAEKERGRAIAYARARWHQGVPIAGTPVEAYLVGRGIDFRSLGKAPGVIRYHPALQYGYQGPKGPGMVAMITALDGTHVATHRTWLRPDGSGKADLGLDARGRPNDPKKVMGPYWGGHIPLWKGVHRCPLKDIPAGTDVYVSEGIEDGLTAACADPSLRIIAGISVGNFVDIALPAQMGALIFLKQNDPAGSEADRMMTRAVKAHRAQGRKVLFVMPPKGVKDLNDLARMGGGVMASGAPLGDRRFRPKPPPLTREDMREMHRAGEGVANIVLKAKYRDPAVTLADVRLALFGSPR